MAENAEISLKTYFIKCFTHYWGWHQSTRLLSVNIWTWKKINQNNKTNRDFTANDIYYGCWINVGRYPHSISQNLSFSGGGGGGDCEGMTHKSGRASLEPLLSAVRAGRWLSWHVYKCGRGLPLVWSGVPGTTFNTANDALLIGSSRWHQIHRHN